MKKLSIQLLLILLPLVNSYSQIINSDYFPENNWIDEEYSIELQEWTGNNGELRQINGKYIDIWKNQMNLELNRLLSILDDQSKEIVRQNHELWISSMEADKNFIYQNINLNSIGQMPLHEYRISILKKFKNRAIYYFTLYYTILEQTSESFNYIEPMLLAE